MKKSLYISVFVLLSLLFSCRKIDLPPFYQQIVVEGWIENGEAPVVQLTASVPPREEPEPFDSLKNYIIKYARVYVTCDGEEHQLYTTVDREHYYPNPVIYTTDTDILCGEVGKKYDLRIEYSGRTVTASTEIPTLPKMSGLHAEPAEGGLYKIYADIIDNPDEENFYKFFIRKEKKDSAYVSAYLALFNDELLEDNKKKFSIANSLGYTFLDYTPYYEKEDVVHVKLCSMTEDVYFYWKDYNDIISFSRNPFVSVNSPIRYNVKGGYGYWAGYGKTEEKIIISNYTSGK